MKKYEVVIRGTYPLLMDKFSPNQIENHTRPISAKTETPQEESERAVYRDALGNIVFPGPAIARLIRDAGVNHKVKGSRRSVRFVVPAAVRIPAELIPLTNGDGKTKLDSYGVDSRAIVNSHTKGRQMKHRPRFEAWSMRFQLTINETLLEPALVKLLLKEGGEQSGLGAFRASCGGPFGCFEVVEWNECPNAK